MHKLKYLTISIILVVILSLAGLSFNVSARPLAQTAPPLGVLQSYSVLAHTGVTNSGPTTMVGDIGTDTSTIGGGITVGPPGTIRTAADASIAQTAAVTAKNSLESQGPGTTLGNSELAGRTLTHGVYTVPGPGASLLTGSVLGGVLTLDGPGVYIFLTNGLIATGTINLINGADSCNVFWRDASSAHINNPGTGGSFIGTIIALTSITMNTGATLEGRAIAQTGDVTLLSNTITGPRCNTTIATALSASSVTTGIPVHDSATLSGTNSSTATGSVTYNVYSNNTCTAWVGTGGIRTITTPGVVPDSLPITFTIPGTYYWQAVYSGDAFNNGSSSPCTGEDNERLTVTAPPVPTNTPIPGVVPGTGFTPRGVTVLSAQPADKAYADLGDLWLEIPRLGVQMPIVGVPQAGGEWDVSWLGKQAGWLNGSAFPTWAGNSVLTGHVWNADNTAGPFRYLNTLWWGDKVIIHAWGAQYVYEVRSVQQVSPNDTAAMMKHQTLPWVTVVTCRGYDQASNSYKYRVLVRAVLVKVK